MLSRPLSHSAKHEDFDGPRKHATPNLARLALGWFLRDAKDDDAMFERFRWQPTNPRRHATIGPICSAATRRRFGKISGTTRAPRNRLGTANARHT
jgi:hypothetical protein